MDFVTFGDQKKEEERSNYNPFVTFIKRQKIMVDEWMQREEDMLFKSVDKCILLPVGKYFGINEPTDLDIFMIAPKRCYNRPDTRERIIKYLNYFEKFYDEEHELFVMLCNIKYSIDYIKGYSKSNLICDLKKYILYNRSLLNKIFRMNEDNYLIELKAKAGRSVSSLQYNTKHGKILMQMSLLMDMIIPLVCHFVHVNNIDAVDDVLLEVFDIILDMTEVDMYSKFYETATTEVKRNQKINETLWKMQPIRGTNPVTHSRTTIENIILNIMPKYTYDRNIISFNFTSIRKSTGFKITDIKYEYTFTMLSSVGKNSSNNDDDLASDFDKFESYMIRNDEGLYLQNKVAAEYTMQAIEQEFGPFSNEEIMFYKQNLAQDTTACTGILNKFQKRFVFNLFYKYFVDPVSIKAINQEDYIKLMLSAKKILESYNMLILPYIATAKVVRIPNRKAINKKELLKIQASPLWKQIQEKYKNPKIEQDILNEIGVIVSSEFKIIDYDDDFLHGKTLECNSEIVAEEYMMYVLMI